MFLSMQAEQEAECASRAFSKSCHQVLQLLAIRLFLRQHLDHSPVQPGGDSRKLQGEERLVGARRRTKDSRRDVDSTSSRIVSDLRVKVRLERPEFRGCSKVEDSLQFLLLSHSEIYQSSASRGGSSELARHRAHDPGRGPNWMTRLLCKLYRIIRDDNSPNHAKRGISLPNRLFSRDSTSLAPKSASVRSRKMAVALEMHSGKRDSTARRQSAELSVTSDMVLPSTLYANRRRASHFLGKKGASRTITRKPM
ncbi:hypothetical protein MRX96_021850 [Rhipicephalus microplus]